MAVGILLGQICVEEDSGPTFSYMKRIGQA